MGTKTGQYKLLSKSDLVGILEIIDESLSAGTESDLRHLMSKTAELIPVERSHVSVADLDGENSIVSTRHQININYPKDWVAAYRQEKLVMIDPVAQRLFRSDKPLIWSQVRSAAKDSVSQKFYGVAGEFGLRDGFSFGARFQQKTTSASFFTCAGKDLTRDRRHIAVIESIVPHLHESLCKVHLGLLKETPVLTPREVEVLNWAKFGKTNGDIAALMGISVRVVKFHIENAIHKLNANNRSQAIAVALSQRLIDWG